VAELQKHKRDLLKRSVSKDRIKLVNQQITALMARLNNKVEQLQSAGQPAP
jgi:hypothetical protein